MELLLSDILRLEPFREARIIAGKNGINNEVAFATVMDVPTIIEWLHGGEMLLAAGIFLDCCSESFLRSLKSKSVSAVITKPDYTVGMDARLCALCDQLSLPIITVPAETAWGDIMNPITQLVAQKQYEVIYQSQLFHATLMRFLMKGDSLTQLCTDIYRMSKLTIALTDMNFALIGQAGNLSWQQALEKFSIYDAHYCYDLGSNINGTPIAGYIYNNFYLSSIGSQAFIFPIIQNTVSCGYVFVLVNVQCQKLTVAESMQIDQISLVTGFDCVKRVEFNNTLRRYNNLLLDRILSSQTIDEQDRAEVEKSLNCHLSDQYYIAIVKISSREHDLHAFSTRISQLFDSIRADNVDFSGVLCFERSNYPVFFIPEEDTFIRRCIERLHDKCRDYLGGAVRIGVSERTHDAFLKAYDQALQTLRYVDVSIKKEWGFYEDLGILRFFIDNSGKLDNDFLAGVVAKYLKPVERYDAQHHGQLKRTLEKYIDNDCSSVKTQNSLFIHKNTLHARLAKIERLLGCSLGSSEDMFNIQMALKIDQCLDVLSRPNEAYRSSPL